MSNFIRVASIDRNPHDIEVIIAEEPPGVPNVSKPLLILDQHFRTVDELFHPADFARLQSTFHVEGGADHPMDTDKIADLLPDAEILIASRPALSANDVANAPNLKAVIEVSGAFHGELDYAACFERGIEVLSCSPGFRQSVAEMGLAMILSGARGLIAEHEAFRVGREAWLDDRSATDFTLYRQQVGLVGYGNIARELHRLLAPFASDVSFFDPWVDETSDAHKCETLEVLFAENRVVVVTATPTAENRHAIDANLINRLHPGALLVLLGRAHVMDFEAALAAANSGHIIFATDVFPSEPVPMDHAMRKYKNVIFSPHRAAAVPGGRRLIGELILHDVEAILGGSSVRRLQRANPATVGALVAAQDAIEADGRLPGT